MIERLPRRLRRSLFGYRRADVLAALEHLGWQLDGLAASVDRLYREREDLRGRLEEADARAAALDAQRAERERAAAERAAIVEATRERTLAETRAEAARLLGEAEEQAARLRHEAGLRVGDAASRLEDLLHVREQLLGELRGLLASYGDLLAEHEGRPRDRGAPAELEQQQPAEPPVGAPAAAVAAGLFPRHVELDAGPFGDFAELSAFERALARLPKVDDVYIRSFGNERATIELSLTEQTPLAHDLATRLPYGVRLERGDDARLLVELLPAAAEG